MKEVQTTRPRKCLRKPAVMEKCGFSTTHLYRLVRQGNFPKPHRIGGRLVAWDEAEIDAWLAEKFSK